MGEGTDPFERRLSRQDLLKLAAVTGGAGLLAGPTSVAQAMRVRLGTAESGRLQVLDWAGYGNDGGQAMFAVREEVPGQQAAVHVHDERGERAREDARGLEAGHLPPVRRLGQVLRRERPRPAVGPELIPNLKHLNPFMVKAGQFNGKQYGIPEDWGFDAILYRTDKVKPKAQARWSLLFDERYKGKIAWFDDLDMLVVAGSTSASRSRGPDGRRAQESQKFLIVEEERRAHVLVVRDRPAERVRGRRHLDRVRVAERLGADEGEEAEGRLHAPEGEADRLGRHADAPQGTRRARARARIRRRLELGQSRRLAREQLRLRAREHSRRGRVERPAARRSS